ncbi:MAG TPA: hypothetical protein VLJ37_07030 [bacterium]|nr:hypothetical protein [bacterium]
MRYLCLLAAVPVLLLVTSCAASRSAWTPLSPLGAHAADTLQRAERVQGGVTVAAELLESKGRYLARVEVRNGGKKPVYGPEDVVLEDDRKVIHQALDADVLKSEIGRRAESEASYTRYSWNFAPGYYYRPRRAYDGRGRYRYVYVGPYVRDDWFERQIEANRILRRAERRIAEIDAEYLHPQEIPPGAAVKGFVQFPKTDPSRNVRLSLHVGKKAYRLEFVSAQVR